MKQLLVGSAFSVALSAAALSCGGSSETPQSTGTGGGAGGSNSSSSSSSSSSSATGVGGSLPTGGASGTGGGSSSGGAAGTGSGSGGEGGMPPEGEVATIGDSCDQPGALACAGNYQKVTLICGGDSTWEAGQVCESGEFCDSTPGPDAGLCKAPPPECVDKMPGDTLCVGDALQACGPDNVNLVLAQECEFGCVDAACFVPKQPGPQDDPCPTDLAINCSDQCAGVTPECAEAECSDSADAILDIPTPGPGEQYTIRLPANPGNRCECSGVQYSLRIRFMPAAYNVSLVMEAPWFAATGTACLPEDQTNCAILANSSVPGDVWYFTIGTEDPSAYSANVTVVAGDQCP